MSTIIFADDTTILFKNKSFENLLILTNNELIKYREWAIANRLSLNANKIHVMIFTTRPIPEQPQYAYHQQILDIKKNALFWV